MGRSPLSKWVYSTICQAAIEDLAGLRQAPVSRGDDRESGQHVRRHKTFAEAVYSLASNERYGSLKTLYSAAPAARKNPNVAFSFPGNKRA